MSDEEFAWKCKITQNECNVNCTGIAHQNHTLQYYLSSATILDTDTLSFNQALLRRCCRLLSTVAPARTTLENVRSTTASPTESGTLSNCLRRRKCFLLLCLTIGPFGTERLQISPKIQHVSIGKESLRITIATTGTTKKHNQFDNVHGCVHSR